MTNLNWLIHWFLKPNTYTYASSLTWDFKIRKRKKKFVTKYKKRKGTFVDLFQFKILFACNSIAQSTFQEYDITLIVMIQKLVNNSTLPCNSKKLAD